MTDLIAFLVTVTIAMGGFALGLASGKDIGRVEVAAGVYQCELKANEDKTTRWVCEKVRP